MDEILAEPAVRQVIQLNWDQLIYNCWNKAINPFVKVMMHAAVTLGIDIFRHGKGGKGFICTVEW